MRSHVGTLLLFAASGFFQAAFAVPVRYFRGWRWEQMWIGQSVTANVLFPLLWAVFAPAAFWRQAAHLPWSHWLSVYAWGLVWGLGGVAWGLTMTRLGLAFANSFVFGVTTITGTLLPLALKAVDSPPHPWLFAAGLAMCVAAVVTVGILRRHSDQDPFLPMPARVRSYPAMISIALFAGVASAGYGLAFAFAFPAIRGLIANGASALSAPLAVVLPAYLGAASVAIPMGALVAIESRSLILLFGKHAAWNWSQALLMGLCAAATALVYGYAGSGAQHPSPNVSFGVFISFLVLGGNLLGLAGGEMLGASRAVRAGMLVSACGLVAGACLLNAR